MAEKQSPLLQLRADPEWFEALDEWRRHQTDLPSRAEAVRRIVAEATRQHVKRRPAKPAR